MVLGKALTTKSEWCPDDPTAFAPTKPWKLPFITTWGGSPNRNRPANSAEEAILLTVVLALGFIRDISGFTAGAVAAMAMLISLIHLLASLSVTVFLYVFHKAQS